MLPSFRYLLIFMIGQFLLPHGKELIRDRNSLGPVVTIIIPKLLNNGFDLRVVFPGITNPASKVDETLLQISHNLLVNGDRRKRSHSPEDPFLDHTIPRRVVFDSCHRI